jgi:hypothetical protein
VSGIWDIFCNGIADAETRFLAVGKIYCFLAMRTPLNVETGAVSLSGLRSPSSSQIAAWSPTSMFKRTTLAPPPPPVDTIGVQALLLDCFFFSTNLWAKTLRCWNCTRDYAHTNQVINSMDQDAWEADSCPSIQ